MTAMISPSSSAAEDVATDTRTIKRGLSASVVLGLGLVSETLELNKDTLRYDGIESKWVIGRLSRISSTVYLRDITAVTKMLSVQPVFIILALLSVVDLVAALTHWTWWIFSPVARVPWLFLDEFIQRLRLIHSYEDLAKGDAVVLGIWLVAVVLTRRRYLCFDVSGRTAFRFRMNGVKGKALTEFMRVFSNRWRDSKRVRE